MGRKITAAARLGGILLVTSMLAACAGMATDKPVPQGAPDKADIVQTLWRGENSDWVYLVQAEPAAGRLDHPVQVDAAWLRDVLDSVEVKAERDRSWPAFDAEQLDRLVPALVHGLARATPDQEAVFALVGEQGGLRFVDPVVVTTGRVFVEDGRLNVIFGLIDVPVEGLFGKSRPAFTPGSRAGRVGKGERAIRSLTWGSDPERDDWFAIAVQRSSGSLPPLAESAEPAPPAEPAAAPQAEPAEPAAAPAGAEADGSRAYSDIRRRLEVLKRLHEDGLITDQEYDRKRAEILEAL